jgi:serine/threonine protein kinase
VSSEDVEKVYEIERTLGEGGFGTVYLGRHKEMGYYRAVKKIPMGRSVEDNEDMMTEIYNLMDLDHPHIIKLSRTYADGRFLYIVSELCNGPSLCDRIMDRPMSEQEAGLAMRHMLKGVSCCHSHYMGHYDIKPENFMYSDPDCKRLKMIDLGLSSGFKHDDNEFKGTVAYMAPEVFHGMYGPEADVWSCGLCLFAMVTRQSFCPLELPDEQVQALLEDRRWVKSQLSLAKNVSHDCMDLLSKMLCYDRHLRITAADALKHPFVMNTYPVPRSSKNKWSSEQENASVVIRSMVDRFSYFGAEPVLVRASLLLMVHIMGYITEETTAHRIAFSMLDLGGSGEVSLDAIEAMMSKYGFTIPPNLDEAFCCVNLSRTGYVTYGNFLAATLPHSLRCREDLCRRVFSLLDHNHDGFIDQDDLAATFLSKNKRKNAEFMKLCREAIIEVSGSPDRLQIDLDEFLHAMTDRLPQIKHVYL